MHMLRKKQPDKSSILPVRPSPPSLSEIQEDVKNANESDFVFTTGHQLDSDLEKEELFDEDAQVEGDGEMKKSIAAVEEQYKKVCRFLDLNKSLHDNQIELNETIEKLGETSKRINTDVTELQKKLESQRVLMKRSDT